MRIPPVGRLTNGPPPPLPQLLGPVDGARWFKRAPEADPNAPAPAPAPAAAAEAAVRLPTPIPPPPPPPPAPPTPTPGAPDVEWVVEFVDKVLGEDLTQIKVIVLFQTAVKPKKCVERTRKQKQERASQINAEERLFLRHVPLLPQARRCGLQSLTRTNKETHLLLSPVRWGKQGEVVALHSSFGPTARNVLSVNGTTDPRKTARS